MSGGGGSRLERLLALLQQGTTESARLAAARQLGELQRHHPRQLHHLLQRILPYLFSEEWPTRRAAASALESVAAAVAEWRPTHPPEADAAADAAARADAAGAWLCFESFDMARVLAHGAPLLASAGDEFEEPEHAAHGGERPRERLLRQRRQLEEQLGGRVAGRVLRVGLMSMRCPNPDHPAP